MFHQIKHIHKQKERIWFKPNKLEESHMVNSLFPKAQERKTNDNSQGKVRGKEAVLNSIPKKTKKDPEEGSCFYCGKTGYWKRNCPAYLNEQMKNCETSTSGELVFHVGEVATVAVEATGSFDYQIVCIS